MIARDEATSSSRHPTYCVPSSFRGNSWERIPTEKCTVCGLWDSNPVPVPVRTDHLPSTRTVLYGWP